MERKSPVNHRLTDEDLVLIGEDEGFVPYTYDDADPKPAAKKTFVTAENARMVDGRWTGPYGGTLTKGYGHTRTTKPGDRLTHEEAIALMRTDAREAESCVHRYVNVPLTHGEFVGAADLFYNVGPGRMKGSTGPDDPGKDGIACLGRSANGRPSTLLSILNKPVEGEPESNYERAATCFTQWRQPGSIFEWGLLKRRIKFMLVFMGLPVARAMLSLPNEMPATDAERYNLVRKCIQIAREEWDDINLLQGNTKPTTVIVDAPPASPKVTTTKADPAAVPATGAAGQPVPSPQPPGPADPALPATPSKPAAPASPSVAAGPAPAKPTAAPQPPLAPVPVPPPAPPVKAAPPPEPPPPPLPPPKDPLPVDLTDPKDMLLSRRFWGLAVTAIGTTHVIPTDWSKWMANETTREFVSWIAVVLVGVVIYQWGKVKAKRPLK